MIHKDNEVLKSAQMKIHPVSSWPLGAVHRAGAETAKETIEHSVLFYNIPTMLQS